MDRFHLFSIFRLVVEAGSFTQAARLLGTSQPSISRSISTLEQSLGTQLLVRGPGRLRPTDAGDRLYDEAVRLLAEVETLEEELREDGAGLHGTLRITAPTLLFAGVLRRPVGAFLRAHPDFVLEVFLDDRANALVDEGIDLAIRAGGPRGDSLIARRIGRVGRALFAAPDYLARQGLPASPPELAGHSCILATGLGADTVWTLTDRHGQEVQVPVRGRYRASNLEGARTGALEGFGIALLAEWCVREDVQEGRLHPVLPDWRQPSRDLSVLYRRTRHMPRRIRTFIDFLTAELAQDPRVQRD